MTRPSRKKRQQSGNQAATLNTSPSPPAIPQGEFISVGASYSGPIPPPAMLKEFNEIIPNGATRILEMAENQAKHRQSLEAAVIHSDISQSRWGLFSALVVVVTATIMGGIVALNGQPAAGVGIAGAPSVALVGIFIYGSSARSAERKQKALTLAGPKKN